MRPRRWPIGILFSAGLVLLVGVLAWLQFTWLGEVSEADRARRQTLLRQRANEFADDFDREIARAYSAFQVDASTIDADPAAFAVRYDAWKQNARAPQLIRGVYMVDASHPEQIREYRPDLRRFAGMPWPADLQPVRDRLLASGAAQNPLDTLSLLRDPIVASIPAVIVPMPQVQKFDVRSIENLRVGVHAIVLVLDREYLRATLLPALADRYFPENDIDAYHFAVVDARDPAGAIFSRGVPAGMTLSPAKADASVSLFRFRPELADRTIGGARAAYFNTGAAVSIVTTDNGTVPRAARPSGSRGTFSVFVEQRSATMTGARGDRSLEMIGPGVRTVPSAAWQLVLQHPAGSLDAAVSETRRRNLALSFGILALLGISVLMIVINAQRSQRLAAQQMDFVATVSHELRTPLTVIRSAAQNLSTGVVHDHAQTRRYGDLIDTEGRRLSEMVEQVLEYAGLNDRKLRNAAPVDVADIVREVAGSFEALLSAEGVQLDVTIEDDLPPVMADAGALRRALQNLLTNALKYGSAGRWIGVEARRTSARGVNEVQISVGDRGRGIEPADLPHIFEPFYRGSHAVREQIHGNGLGLSLVKRIVEAHGGRVSVKAAPGQGAVFAIGLKAES